MMRGVRWWWLCRIATAATLRTGNSLDVRLTRGLLLLIVEHMLLLLLLLLLLGGVGGTVSHTIRSARWWTRTIIRLLLLLLVMVLGEMRVWRHIILFRLHIRSRRALHMMLLVVLLMLMLLRMLLVMVRILPITISRLLRLGMQSERSHFASISSHNRHSTTA